MHLKLLLLEQSLELGDLLLGRYYFGGDWFEGVPESTISLIDGLGKLGNVNNVVVERYIRLKVTIK